MRDETGVAPRIVATGHAETADQLALMVVEPFEVTNTAPSRRGSSRRILTLGGIGCVAAFSRRRVAEQHGRPHLPDNLAMKPSTLASDISKTGSRRGAHQNLSDQTDTVLGTKLDRRAPDHDLRIPILRPTSGWHAA